MPVPVRERPPLVARDPPQRQSVLDLAGVGHSERRRDVLRRDVVPRYRRGHRYHAGVAECVAAETGGGSLRDAMTAPARLDAPVDLELAAACRPTLETRVTDGRIARVG